MGYSGKRHQAFLIPLSSSAQTVSPHGFLPSWPLPGSVPSRALSPAWGRGLPSSIPSVPAEVWLVLPGSGQTPLGSLLQFSPHLSLPFPPVRMNFPSSWFRGPSLLVRVFRPLVYYRSTLARQSLPAIVTLKGRVYESSPALYAAFHYRYLKDGHWSKLNCLLNCNFGC